MRISAVGPAAAAAGLRMGDTVNLPRTDSLSRLVLVMQSDSPSVVGQVGDKIVLAVQRADRNLSISVPLVGHDPPGSIAIDLIFKLFLLFLGIFVLWRGRDLASLFLGIWTLGLLVPLPVGWFGAFSEGGRLAFSILSAFLWTYSPIPLYLIIESLARTFISRPIVATTRLLMAACMIPSLFEVCVNAVARVTSGCALLPLRAIADLAFIATQVVIVGFFVLSYVATRGEQRQRIQWVFWSFVCSRFGVFANLLGRITGHPLELYGFEWLTVLIFPAGCAYGILRHKLMDVNFVINRAIVYSILTTIVVGFFLALEALLQHFSVARGWSLVVEVALAVGIGLSMNTVHQRVETAIERVLFSRKHRAEAALTRLADEASFIESADALMRRVVGDISFQLGAQNVGIYERRDGAYQLSCSSVGSKLPETIDADDTAFIRLRKSLAEVDLEEVVSGLGEGGYAFPLSVRGRMFGALICGRRQEDDAYAPDERELLRHVAREVAAELHLIRSRDLADLAQAIASGTLSLEDARKRARELTMARER